MGLACKLVWCLPGAARSSRHAQDMNGIEITLRRLENRDWWLWSGAIIVTLLLTGAVVSLSLPHVLIVDEAESQYNLSQNLRGLIGLVLLFDIYTIYQQMQMTRLRRQLVKHLNVNTALEVRAEELKNLAVLDPLTGLYNRRLVEERLAEEVSRSQRGCRPLTVLSIDMDNFKQINDGNGHAAGDLILQECAAHLKKATRASDVVARMGGDEFLVLLPECSEAQVSHVLNHLGPFEVDFKERRIPVAFSIGTAEYRPGELPARLLERADQNLYEEKRSRKASSQASLV